MKRIINKIPREKLRRLALWLDNTIEGNAGWLIAFAIVFFGLANLGFQKDNRQIIQNTNETIKTMQRILENQQTIIKNLEVSNAELKADNAQQTRILCRLILGGGVELSEAEANEVERICEEAIKRENQAFREDRQARSQNTFNENSEGLEPVGQPSGQQRQQNRPEPAPAPQPNAVDRLFSGTGEIVQTVRGIIGL